MRFFFYGTLIDPDVRRIVLGARAAQAAQLQAAELRGWTRRAVRGVGYPIIFPRADGRVPGLLVCGLDAQARRRLEGYEGADYEVVSVTVSLADGRRKPALVFAANRCGRLKPATTAWSYEAWFTAEKSAFLREIAGVQRVTFAVTP